MASKRSRSGDGRRGERREENPRAIEPRIEPDPRYPHIAFESQEQKVKFAKLCPRVVVPTRFLDHVILQRLGILDDMRLLFVNIGLNYFFNLSAPTYPDLVYEFLSSIVVHRPNQNRPVRGVSYRLGNRSWTLSAKDFGDIFGLTVDGTMRPSKAYEGSVLWRMTTGQELSNWQHAHAGLLHQPALRIAHRFMAGTIFGRREPNNCSRIEMAILGQHLVKRTFPYSLNIVHHFLLHLQTQSNTFCGIDTRPNPIVFGGLISRLAMYHGISLVERDLTEGSDLLDFDYLSRLDWVGLTTRDKLRWYLGPRKAHSVLLPNSTLTSLAPDQASYLMAADGHEDIPEYGTRTYMRRDPGQSSQQQQPPEEVPLRSAPPPFGMYEMRTAIEGLQNRFDTFQVRQDEFMQRFDTYLQDQRLAMYPIYDHYVRQGVVPAVGPHPSWYTYPMGGFGQHGESTSRMDGDDDDGGDTVELLQDSD